MAISDGPDVIRGTAGNDQLHCGSANENDTIYGYGGNDVISGVLSSGANYFDGGDGNAAYMAGWAAIILSAEPGMIISMAGLPSRAVRGDTIP